MVTRLFFNKLEEVKRSDPSMGAILRESDLARGAFAWRRDSIAGLDDCIDVAGFEAKGEARHVQPSKRVRACSQMA